MQIKIKGKVLYTYSVKRLICALCFLLFCIIDQRLKSEGHMEVFCDLTGVGMAVIIMTHYRPEDFQKWKVPYLIWTGIWAVGAPIAFLCRNDATALLDWLVIELDVILFGYILIHTFVSAVIEKNRPKLNAKAGFVWLAMMVLMIFSRSRYIWPFCYLVMFGCFYLTDYSEEEQNELFQGMLDGIILGFFALQGFCFVFRPYDVVRYNGAFANCNVNALFYDVVLAAVYAKIIYVTRIKSKIWVKLYYWTGAGVVLSLLLLTLGRTGWITAAVLSLLFCGLLVKQQVSKRWWKNLVALAVCVVIAFPLTFGAVRYLPPMFHHPVWFWDEWNKYRVHSWDPWDSEKYIDIDEFLDAALGRVLKTIQNIMEHSPFLLKADAAEAGAAEASTADKEPPLDQEQGTDSLLVRGSIYKYFFQHLNMRGHPYEEQGFQLTPTYWVPHAHNIYLQYGTDFGIPVMILFTVFILGGAVLLGRRSIQRGSEVDVGCWMFLLITAIFGMLEYSWGAGTLNILLMFVAWKKTIIIEEWI